MVVLPSSDPVELRQFCLSLPKLDLHAHLSGCIAKQTLHKIWKLQKAAEADLALEDPLIAMDADGVYEHKDFFSLFSSYIYQLVNNVEAVRIATEDTLKNHENDGVVHFEVRTTPRAFEATNMSKDLYVQTIVSAITRSNQESKKMKAYLILSVDRRNTAAEAMETVDLAIKYHDQNVVGVDLCGDSLCGDISIFRTAFAKAKAAGLHITLHFGEEPSCLPELMTLLSYEPTRLGHLLFLTPEARQEIITRKLGIELCLTSNIKGAHVPSYADHHLVDWLKEDCPIALCTDNVGVVGSPNSNEYYLAATNFPLSYIRLWEIAMSGINATFVDEETKESCRRQMIAWKESEGTRWIK